MKIQYENFNFRQGTISLIGQANEIVAEYMAEGYELTLRQLYYQFVARGIIPNKENEYKRLGGIVSDSRLAGLVDWDAIVDRTRQVKANSHWDNPAEIIQDSADSYAIDTRATQPDYVEAWVEKEALAGVLARACEPLDVPYFSCKGYVSQSAMWRAARRIAQQTSRHRTVYENETKGLREAVVLYLGDHDPSGIDMTRDVQDRLELFRADVEVKRIALTMEQIQEFNPPPNPAKVTDSRCNGYIAQYGNKSWELDALDPRTINALVIKEVDALTNTSERKKLIKKQEQERKKLQIIADDFDNLSL